MSRNVVAVKLAERVGVDRVIEYAHRMGVTAPLEANLSLALGSSVVSVSIRRAATRRSPTRACTSIPRRFAW